MDDADLPEPKSVWKEFSAAMRAVEGHNNRTRSSVDRYWATVGPLEWPQKAIFVIPDADRWPKPRTLKALPMPATTSTGKKPVKPVSVSGRKYSQRGGYSSKVVGPGPQPKLAAALVEAANYSLVARAVMSLKMMSRAHSNLRKLKITSRRKKTIWATMVFMFMGSLRGS